MSRWQLIRLVVAILGAAACISCAADLSATRGPDEQCVSYDSQAAEAVDKADFKKAAKLYRLAVEAAERSKNVLLLPKVLGNLADLDIAERNFAGADSCLRRALERITAIEKNDSHSANTLELREWSVLTSEALAGVLVKEGKLGEAERLYKQTLDTNVLQGGAVEINQRIARVYSRLLRTLKKNDEADQLEVESNAANLTALDINTEMDKTFDALKTGIDPAKLCLVLRSYALAAQRLQKQDKLEKALHYLGISELLCGRVDEARRAFEKESSSIVFVGNAKSAGNEKSEARREFNKNLAQGLICSGFCLELEGKENESQTLYRRALNTDRVASIQALSGMGKIMGENGQSQYAKRISVRVSQWEKG